MLEFITLVGIDFRRRYVLCSFSSNVCVGGLWGGVSA